MPRKLQRYVEAFRDRHGAMRLYFRIGQGSRIPLPKNPESPEFKAAYAAALSGTFVAAPRRQASAAPGSIAALVESYLKSDGYVSLRPTTKTGYSSRLEHLRIKHGHRSVKGLTRERILTGIMQPYAGKPGAALSLLKMLRILIRYAIAIGWLTSDPSFGIKRPKIKRIRSWTEEEIGVYRARWPLGTLQRTAFEMFLNTGQRRSDIVRMARSHISPDNKITVVQQKTGRRLVIPLHRDALAGLAATEGSNVSLFTTAYGKAFSVDGFSQWIRDAIAEAGLPLECQPHGLRKATGRRLAEAGASARQIMAILGHTTLSEAERYTEEADQVALADDAITKLEGHNRNNISQTASASLGKTEKRKGKSK
jgi:integrase